MGKVEEQMGKPVPNHHLGRDVTVVLLLFVSGFTFLSLHTAATGMAGIYLSKVLRWLFGDVADAVGFLFLLAAVLATKSRGLSRWAPKIVGIASLFVTVLIGVHLLTATFLGISTSAVRDWWYFGQPPGTGVVGALLTYWALKVFGGAGTRLLLVFMVVLSAILLFDLSIVKMGRGVAGWVAGRNRTGSPWAFVPKKEGRRGRLRISKGAGGSRQELSQPREQPAVESKEAMAATAADQQNVARVGTELTGGRALPDAAPTKEKPQVREKTASSAAASEGREVSNVVQFPVLISRHKGQMPGLDIFYNPGRRQRAAFVDQSSLLEEKLASFGVEARVVSVSNGPVITRYEIQPGPGVKVSKITNLADDLALALAAESVRIEAPVPGKPVVGIEVPNRQPQTVYLREVLESKEYQRHPSKLAVALGKDISGKPVVADLKKILHLLIAGATGAGKSVCLNAIIASLLFRATPDEVKLLMIDPKRVELANYNGLPHLVSPVVADPKKAAVALRWAVAEMERRYQLFSEVGVRNIDGYNELAARREGTGDQVELEILPYIVVIVDELADLMLVAAADVEDAICRLAQMARAAGMFLIIATQRPSVDVITGLIKANIPSRIAFAVASQADSRTILDMSGAERLLGKGDMLFMPIGASKAIRAQGAWIFDKDVERLVEFWKQQSYEAPEVDIVEQTAAATAEDTEVEDELFDDAVQLVIDTGQASISMLQRRFRIGYSRAARLIDAMELKGIVGHHQGSKPREVLVDSYPVGGEENSGDDDLGEPRHGTREGKRENSGG